MNEWREKVFLNISHFTDCFLKSKIVYQTLVYESISCVFFKDFFWKWNQTENKHYFLGVRGNLAWIS